MKNYIRKYASQAAYAVLLWALLVLFNGYTMGVADQSEVLPYALRMAGAEDYPRDFFQQGLSLVEPNERYFVAAFLSVFVPCEQPALVILHLLATVSLVLGLMAIARRYLRRPALVYAVPLLALLVFYRFNLGSTELWSDSVIGSFLSYAIGVWAIVVWLRGKFVWACALLVPATLFAPLDGFQLFLLLAAGELWKMGPPPGQPFGRTASRRPLGGGDRLRQTLPQVSPSQREGAGGRAFLLGCFLYALCAGFYVYHMQAAFQRFPADILPDGPYYQTIFFFRNAHHFDPGLFTLKGYLLLVPLAGAALFYFFRSERRVFGFLAAFVLGVGVYLIGFYGLGHSPSILASQWFRVSVWLKPLGIIAGLALAEKRLPAWGWLEKPLPAAVCLGLAACILAAVTLFPEKLPRRAEYHFGHQTALYPELGISEQLRSLPDTALVVQPFRFPGLCYYGRTNIYVDFVANLKWRPFVREWRERIAEVYGLRSESGWRSTDGKAQAEAFYRRHTPETLASLARKGVTHFLTYRDHVLPGLPKVAENAEWAVYRIDGLQ